MGPQFLRLFLVLFCVAAVTAMAFISVFALVRARVGRRLLVRGERRVAWSFIGAFGFGVACFLYALLIEADWLEVTRHLVSTSKLRAGERIRIAHITDLHIEGPTKGLDALARALQVERPDVLVFTGDSLNAEEGLATLRSLLSKVEAPLGRYAVRGNHDVWPSRKLDLFGNGVAVELSSSEPQLSQGDPRLALCGAGYGVTGHLKDCIERAPEHAFLVVAYHTPDLIEELAPLGPDLYLAGHTHGGQVRLPLFGAVVTMSNFDKKYEMGRYRVGQTELYVSRGVGFESLGPRIRFLCRPELAIIDLQGTR
jgi:uncharacterized protein